jgi:hypothetical protein
MVLLSGPIAKLPLKEEILFWQAEVDACHAQDDWGDLKFVLKPGHAWCLTLVWAKEWEWTIYKSRRRRGRRAARGELNQGWRTR